MNKHLKILLHWLSTNKISLNVTKTEVVTFSVKGKTSGTDPELKIVVEIASITLYEVFKSMYQ